MAIERVPPRREAGAGLALPAFNKECEAPLIFFRAKRGDFLRSLPCLRVCVGSLSAGLSWGLLVRASRIPSRLRASGALGELRNTFALLHFLAFPLFFFFSLSFFLHYLRIKVGTFLLRVPGFFIYDLAAALIYATLSDWGGQGSGV